MPRTLRAALTTVLAILLSVSLLSGTPRAEASPVTPDAPSRYPTVTLSTTQWAAVKLVTKTGREAVSGDGKKLDYKKAIKIFAVNKKYGTDWRRQMAAGFRQAGGKITGVSKAENKKIETMRKKIYGKKKPRALLASRQLPDGPDCKGRSGKLVVNKNESHTYFNSCETSDIMYTWGGCIATMSGVVKYISPKVPQTSIPASIIGLFCTLQLGVVARAQNNSDERAIYVRAYHEQTYTPYPGGLRYYITYTVESQ